MEGSTEPTAGGPSHAAPGRSPFGAQIGPRSGFPRAAVPRVETDLRTNRGPLSRDRSIARTMIATLNLPSDPVLQDVVEAVERHRGRRILVRDLPLARGLSGFCLRLDDFDLLVGTTRSSERRRIHVRNHELGHLLFDDLLVEEPPAACTIASHNLISPKSLTAGLSSVLPPETVEKVLTRPVRLRRGTRDHLTDPGERLPETFALEVLSILRLDESTAGSGPIATAFGHRPTSL